MFPRMGNSFAHRGKCCNLLTFDAIESTRLGTRTSFRLNTHYLGFMTSAHVEQHFTQYNRGTYIIRTIPEICLGTFHLHMELQFHQCLRTSATLNLCSNRTTFYLLRMSCCHSVYIWNFNSSYARLRLGLMYFLSNVHHFGYLTSAYIVKYLLWYSGSLPT